MVLQGSSCPRAPLTSPPPPSFPDQPKRISPISLVRRTLSCTSTANMTPGRPTAKARNDDSGGSSSRRRTASTACSSVTRRKSLPGSRADRSISERPAQPRSYGGGGGGGGGGHFLPHVPHHRATSRRRRLRLLRPASGVEGRRSRRREKPRAWLFCSVYFRLSCSFCSAQGSRRICRPLLSPFCFLSCLDFLPDCLLDRYTLPAVVERFRIAVA